MSAINQSVRSMAPQYIADVLRFSRFSRFSRLSVIIVCLPYIYNGCTNNSRLSTHPEEGIRTLSSQDGNAKEVFD